MAKKFVLRDGNTNNEIENKTTDNDEINGNVAPVASNFTTYAYSIVSLGGQWYVVEIPIDPLTKEAGEWTLIQEDGSKLAAIERFKINAANNLMNV